MYSQVSTEVKAICKTLVKPSEATTKTLAKIFPGSMKRKFDPLAAPVNSENKRKKKAAVQKCKGRPKLVPVVYLKSNPNIIPKGTSRDNIKKEGRIKDIPFHRFISRDEVKELINVAFPKFSKNFKFLQGHKNNTLSVASNQELDGTGVIDLAKHGSLYLLEQHDLTAEEDDLTEEDTMPSAPKSHEVSQEASLSEVASPSLEGTSSAHEDSPDDVMERADAIIEKLKVSVP